MPLVFLPEVTFFSQIIFLPTEQYIIKNFVIISAAFGSYLAKLIRSKQKLPLIVFYLVEN
jgi:hypothetical protein